MMRKFVSLFAFVCCVLNSFSQSLAINTDGSTAHNSAMLDVKSTTKGMLIPRMSKAQRNAIATPANGLMLYVNAPDTIGLCFYDGSVWKWMEEKGSGWSLTGNSGTNPNNNFIGTNDFNDLAFRTNGGEYMRLTKEAELGISETDPKYAIDVRTGWAAVNNCANNGVRIKRNFANNDCETGLLLGYQITFPEENNAMIWNYGNSIAQPKNMLFGLGNVEVMRLTNNHELGINVLAPKYNLDITTGGTGFNPCTRGGLRLNTFSNSSDCDKGLFLGFDQMGIENKISLWNFTPNASSTNQFIRFGFGPNFSQDPPPTGFGEAMRILPPGQGVGIGVTAPMAMLHIMKSTVTGPPTGLMVTKYGLPGPEFRGFYSGLGTLNNPSGNDGIIWNYQNANLKFGTNDLERMVISADGKVGIGEDTPGFPLNFTFTVGDKISLSGNSGPHYGFGIQTGLLQIHSRSTIDNIAFGYGSSSSFTERARIINEGEYGMQLTGRMVLRTGTQSAGIWLNNNANNSLNAFMGMETDNHIGFYGNTGAGWGLVMNTANGNTGIGITTPNAPLQLANTIANRKIVLYDANDNDHQYYGFGINGGALRYQTDDVAADHAFYAGASSSTSNELMRIKGDGNVGIGTSSPLERLHVIGNVLANSYLTPSDVRYKKGIQPITNSLEKLQQINGVTYRFNQTAFPEWQFDDKRQYGLIAQEVEMVFPEMVKTIDEKGYKGVDYVKLIPVLLEAIKELKKENNQQQQQIDQLSKAVGKQQ